MLNVKGITKVFKKWKTAKACTLHVFPPTMNEQFSMNKFACTFGKVELVFFDSQSKGNYKGFWRVEKCRSMYSQCFLLRRLWLNSFWLIKMACTFSAVQFVFCARWKWKDIKGFSMIEKAQERAFYMFFMFECVVQQRRIALSVFTFLGGQHFPLFS